MKFDFSIQPWESKFLQHSFSKFTFYEDSLLFTRNMEFVNKIISNRISELKQPEYITASVSSTNYGAFRALEDLGFHYLVSMVDMHKRFNPQVVGYHRFEIRPYKTSDWDSISDIAETSFKYSRYHAEHDFSAGLANEMHKDWAKNCCDKVLADETFVYESIEKVLGFISIKKESPDSKIVLVAVNNDYTGVGIGTSLVQAACGWAEYSGSYGIKVRTEVPNVAAINIYNKNGFTIDNSLVYFGKTCVK